jgi:ketosteroid isomerase-like protein
MRALLVLAFVAGAAVPAAAQGGVPATRIDAFTALLDTDTVFVSESGPPARGHEAVRHKWAVFFDPKGPSLTWEPYEGEVGSQGDLGYTRGKFLFQGKDEAGKPVTERGEYLTIWRKQQDGSWRVVVDSSLPAADAKVPPVKGAPSRVIVDDASGDLRYAVVATRVEPATTGPDSGAGRERRVVRIERRGSDGVWSTAVEAVTYGTAPNQ